MTVIVVGAGIAGLSLARALVGRGARVVVVARDHGFTAAGAGIVSAQFHDPTLAALAAKGREALAALVPVHRCGMAQIAVSAAAGRQVAAIPGGEHRLPAALERALHPRFAAGITAVSWSADELWLDNRRLLRALARDLDRRDEAALEIRQDAVRTASGWLRANAVVAAAGPWLGTLVRRLAIERRRAVIVRVATRLPAMFHVWDGGLYGRPAGLWSLAGDGDAPWRRGGCAGAERIASAALRQIARRLRRTLGRPGAVLPHRAGLVVRVPRGGPIATRRAGVWVFGGFHGDGLALASALAGSLAERILGERT